MKLNAHANLLSIFSFVIGGLQMLLSLLLLVYVVAVGFVGVLAILDPKAEAEAAVVFVILAIVVGLLFVLSLIAAVTNLYLGFRFRKPEPVGKKTVMFGSIVNLLSFMNGGMFAMALGGYELWFAMSDEGRRYFAGEVYQQQAALPQMPVHYGMGQEVGHDANAPYKWR